MLKVGIEDKIISHKFSKIILIKEHFNYAKKLIGVDHIGIGADFDGVLRLQRIFSYLFFY